MIAITVTVLYNANALAMSQGFKEGDFLNPVSTFVVFKHKPTLEYLMDTLPQQVFNCFNGMSNMVFDHTILDTGLRSMSLGDVVKIQCAEFVGKEFCVYQAVESHGWRLII